MEELTISVKVAERTYKMTIDPKEEEIVRKAAKLINEKIKDYSGTYAYNDIQDLLSMVALQFATSTVKYDEILESMDNHLANRLKEVNKLLIDQLE
jgi:cell division protein ZapA